MSEQDELEALLAQEVDKEVAAINVDTDLYDACKVYADTRSLLTRAEKYVDDLKEKCQNLVDVIVPAMESAKLKSIKIEGLGRIGTAKNNWPKVVDSDKLNAWLYEVGEEGVIKHEPNYMALKGLLNRRAEDHLPLPDVTIVELNPKPGLRFTREKPA